MNAHADTQYGSKVIASDRSNYWRYYGLHRDPFMPIVEDSNFFLPARWEQYFDLLQYLCESTNVLLSVIGVKGSGKTTFMRQFIAQASDTAKISRLVGSAVLTAPQLSKTLIKDFNLPNPVGDTSEEQWESLCHSMQSGTQPYLLVIDDAHRLPQETLRAILGLIKQQSEHQMRLHVLLIGETQLTGLLNALKEGEGDRELIHTVTLEPLNLQDTEAYIKHRLLAAGLPGGMPLRTTDVARIFKLSEGVPGRINAVARQVLIEIMQQRQLYGFSHFLRTRRTPILGGVVILAALTALALLLTRGENDPAYKLYKLITHGKTTEIASTTNNIANNTTATTITTNTTNNTAAPADKTMVMPTAIISKTEMQELSSPGTATTHTTTTRPAAAINTSETIKLNTDHTTAKTTSNGEWYSSGMMQFKSLDIKHPEKTAAASKPTLNQTPAITAVNNNTNAINAVSATTKPTFATAPVTATHQTVVPVKAATPALITAQQRTTTANAIATSDRLLTPTSPLLSNPKHFTLQLVGVSSEASVERFISKNQLTDQAYYYQSKLHDKSWYVVVYGDYASKQDAEQALANLPEAVRDLHPWARTMASVLTSVQHGEEVDSQATTTVQTTASPVQSTSTEATTGKP